MDGWGYRFTDGKVSVPIHNALLPLALNWPPAQAAESRGEYPAAPGGLSLGIGVGGLGHQVETGDGEDTSEALADLWPKQQGKVDL